MTQLRVGIVNYINSRPLSRGLLRGRQVGGFACESLPPAVIADRLAAGTLDDFELTLQVNLVGSRNFAAAVLPHMSSGSRLASPPFRPAWGWPIRAPDGAHLSKEEP